MQIIPLESWPRREVFAFFSHMSHPFYSVTFRVDVTDLYRYTKARGISFYYALIYLCTGAINAVDAFHYALVDGQLVRLDARKPSFTDLKKGAEQFHLVSLPCGGDLDAFCRAARAKSLAQTTFIAEPDSPDMIYYSCLPWLALTALTNERDLDPDDSVPRLSWGKYTEENGRKILHMSVEANHRFVDGLHIGRFYEALCAAMQQLDA